jgi:cation transporter-like permease
VIAQLLAAVPIAVACSVPIALLGALLHRMRRHSITAAVIVLAMVPVLAALAGVIGVATVAG